MKKKISIILLILLIPGSGFAGRVDCKSDACHYWGEYRDGWSYDCQNDSCVMTKGIIRVGFNRLDFDRSGVSISGISGLPIRVEDFSSIQSKVVELFSVESPAGGASELLKGHKIDIDHTLRFVNWSTKFFLDGIGITEVHLWDIFRNIDFIMEAYNSGNIIPHIEIYFLIPKIDNIKNADYTDEKTSKRLLFLKYYLEKGYKLWGPLGNTTDEQRLDSIIGFLFAVEKSNEPKFFDAIFYKDFQDTLTEKRQRPQAEKYFVQANELLKAGNFKEAINMFDKVLAIFPDNISVKENRLIAETSLKTEEEAKAKAEEEAKAKNKIKVKKVQKSKPSKNGGTK